jgi:hypothetical protein
MPSLKSQYLPQQIEPHTRTFESQNEWTAGNKERAERFHIDMALKFLNFGGQIVDSRGVVQYLWWLEPNSNILPTLTAGLLLSFVLTSLSRYRANLLDRVESSKINIIHEVFANEADGIVIPALRNLLYAETMYIETVGYT